MAGGASQIWSEYIKFCIVMDRELKTMCFLGAALDELRAFPDDARREAGYQLDRVQRGHTPTDWKPMRNIGPGVREIRVRDAGGAFRVIYVVRLGATVYVLRCFQKKAEKTSKLDIECACDRYRRLLKEW
jgi:phage-related protein